MNFLANENFPLDAVMVLRQAGHDVSGYAQLPQVSLMKLFWHVPSPKIGCCSRLTKILVSWQFGVACRPPVALFSFAPPPRLALKRRKR